MKVFTLYNSRLAIRNLIFATLISIVYLIGKHYQGTHQISGNANFKVGNLLHKQ